MTKEDRKVKEQQEMQARQKYASDLIQDEKGGKEKKGKPNYTAEKPSPDFSTKRLKR